MSEEKKTSHYAALDYAMDILGDMGLPDESYEPLIESWMRGRWAGLVFARNLVESLLDKSDYHLRYGDFWDAIEKEQKK